MTTQAFLQQWLNTDLDIPVAAVDFTFLPDPDVDNWMEDAILHAQEGIPELALQPIFALTVPTDYSMGNGDVIGYQCVRGSLRNVLWIHDYPWEWGHGGSHTIDPDDAEGFIIDWWNEEDALELAIDIAYDVEPKDAIATIAEEEKELSEMIERFVKDFETRFKQGTQVPHVPGSNIINDAIAAFVERAPNEDEEPVLSLFNNATWICQNLVGQVVLPTEEQLPGWQETIDLMLADPSKFGPASTHTRLWASFFTTIRTQEVVDACKSHSWRVIADSAKLVDRLLKDPTIGKVTLTTCETLQARLREQEEEAERQRVDAANVRQKKIDDGRVILDKLRDMPRDFDRGISFKLGSELPEAIKEAFPYVTDHTDGLHQNFRGMYGFDWVGQTETDHWVGFNRATEKDSAGNRLFDVVVGRADDLKTLYRVNGYHTEPSNWWARGQTLYCITNGTMHEIDMETGDCRSLIGIGAIPPTQDDGALISAALHSVTFTEEGFWACTDPGDGAHVRRFKYQPGQDLEEVEAYHLWSSALAFRDDTLLALTYKLGLFCMTQVDGEWVVYQRHAFEPNTALSQYVAFREKEGRLYLDDHGKFYEVVNLENADRSGGIRLVDLIEDWDRLSDVPIVE